MRIPVYCNSISTEFTFFPEVMVFSSSHLESEKGIELRVFSEQDISEFNWIPDDAIEVTCIKRLKKELCLSVLLKKNIISNDAEASRDIVMSINSNNVRGPYVLTK